MQTPGREGVISFFSGVTEIHSRISTQRIHKTLFIYRSVSMRRMTTETTTTTKTTAIIGLGNNSILTICQFSKKSYRIIVLHFDFFGLHVRIILSDVRQWSKMC